MSESVTISRVGGTGSYEVWGYEKSSWDYRPESISESIGDKCLS